MKIIKISALTTNYIWVIYNHKNECIIVDPGESVRILKLLKKLKLIPKAILLTHCHYDHTNGVYDLLKLFPKITIYGPIQNLKNTIIVSEGDTLLLLNKKFIIFNLPGHTNNHIGFYCNPWLFSGDTVFSAGCGKVQKGLIKKMYKSFLKIQSLPINTIICSGHEYTLENLNFAISILPNDLTIINHRKKILKSNKQKITILPTTLELELKINLFFRCHEINIKKSLGFISNFQQEWKIFEELRNRKDIYKNHSYYLT